MDANDSWPYEGLHRLSVADAVRILEQSDIDGMPLTGEATVQWFRALATLLLDHHKRLDALP